MFKVLLSILCLLLPLIAKAEPLEITIYAFRTSSDLAYKTYSYDVIEPEEIKTLPSVNMVQSGPDGQMSSIFLRGTNSNHTLITLNGIAIKDHSTPGGSDDLSQHSFLGVDRIEVIKGPMGSTYGPNSIGGTINMITNANDENSVSISHGSNNTNTQVLKFGKVINNTLVDFRIENETSDGISVVDGDEKDSLKNRNYILQTESFLGNGLVLKSNIIETNNHTNLDKSSDYTDYTADWQFNNYYLSLQDKDTEVTLNHTKHDRVYDDKGTKDIYKNDTTILLGKHSISVDNKTHTIGSEYETSNIEFDTNISGYVSNVDKTRNNTGYFYNLDQTHESGVQSHIGFRYDTPNTFDDQLTYRIGAENNGVRLSYSTGFKAPTVYEMFGQNNYGFVGNSELIPEESKTVELGYKKGLYNFAVYKTEIDNLLKYSSNTYVNDTKTSNIKGFEFDYTGTWFQNKYSYNISEDGDGHVLLRRPKVINNTKLFYNEYSVNVNYYGKHKDIDASTYATKNMSAITTVDLQYNKDINSFKVFANLNNVFDEDYEKPDGYNQLGRNFEIGFKKTF